MTEDFKIISKRNSFTARFNYVLFPFTSAELMFSLNQMNLGYQLLPPPPRGNIPIGVKADWGGPIAKKGNTVITVDSLPQILGVEGSSPEEVSDVYSEMEEIVKNTLAKDLDSHLFFYELVLNYSVQSKKSPISLIRKIKPENNLYTKIGTIFGEEIASFSLHLSSTTEIEDSHWFDLRIQPVTTKSNTTFDIVAVYRDKDKSKVDKFTKNVEDYLEKIILELDKS